MSDLSSRFASLLERFTHILLYALIFFLPFVYAPFTLDVLEINKQTVLVLVVALAALAHVGSMLLRGRIEIETGWMHLVPVVGFGAVCLSALFSIAPYRSWVGGSGIEYASVLTLFALLVLYFLLVQTAHKRTTQQTIHTVLLFSGLGVTILGALTLFGIVSLPGATSVSMLTTVGTPNAFGILALVYGLYSLGVWVFHQTEDALLHRGMWGRIEACCVALLSMSSLFSLVLLDYWVLWTLYLIGLTGILIVFSRKWDQFSSTRVIPVMLLASCAMVFLIWVPSPLAGSIPIEIGVSQETSWEITRKTIQDESLIFGSGPGTFSFDFSRYKNPSINKLPIWNIRIDRASSYVLTALATYGLFPFVLAVLFFLIVVFNTGLVLLNKESLHGWLHVAVGAPPLVVLLVAATLYPFNLTLLFFLVVFLALISSQLHRKPFRHTFDSSQTSVTFATGIFCVCGLVFCVGIFFASQRYLSQVAYAEAIRLDRTDASTQEILIPLDRAARLNRYDDVAYRALAQALLLQLQEALPTTQVQQLDAEHEQYLRALASSAVNAAVRATELSPQNGQNWIVRGLVYRSLMDLVPDAGGFARAAHEQAVTLEPANPRVWLELGRTQLALAQPYRALSASDDSAISTPAKQELNTLLQSAEASLQQAIDLKADYAMAHYETAVLYEQQGRINDAVGKMESVARYNPKDVGVAFQLGLLYLQRNAEGDLARSKEALAYAVGLVPSYANAHWFLATVYEIEGDLETALDIVRRVSELDPNNPLVSARLKRLEAGVAQKQIPDVLERSTVVGG